MKPALRTEIDHFHADVEKFIEYRQIISEIIGLTRLQFITNQNLKTKKLKLERIKTVGFITPSVPHTI